jgi:2-keto-4-pentenoate hydratase/2-oxohepta-3-ene-1,7-dioic acid hydratase in catechol pathway
LLLYRTGPEGFYVVAGPAADPRVLFSEPLVDDPSTWELGRKVDLARTPLLAPVLPGKIVGVGRNYVDHARELGNEPPSEPLLFLKSPSSVIGPKVSVILPPESERVDFEGEIAVVLRHRLCRATAAEAAAAVLGVTCACDVTARDLQRRDATFARAKSFDTFCPLGPAILVRPQLEDLEVITRINGEERQRGHTNDLTFPIRDLLVYISAMMTLDPGDVVLTGTPAGVGPLGDGDRIEVEIPGVGVLDNPVENWRQGAVRLTDEAD